MHTHLLMKRWTAAILSVMFFLMSTDAVALAGSLKSQKPAKTYEEEFACEILGKCPPNPKTKDFNGDGEISIHDLAYFKNHSKKEKFAPGQLKKLSYEGAEMEVDPKALKEEKDLYIASLADISWKPLNRGMINVTRKHQGFRFLRSGRFEEKIKVKLPYDKKKVEEAGFTENEVRTYYYNEILESWQPLERIGVNEETRQVESYTEHFTDLINAVVTVPEAPDLIYFNPNQFKDMQAANPGANITQVDPPQVNNNGSATLSYPIQVPPGRSGLQPQLAIQYNSDSGNGWLGLGWDSLMQAISIDTRWGVPRYGIMAPYQGLVETETYTLNGQQLTPLAHRTAPVPRTAEKVFHSRVEGAFNLIIRHGDHPNNYWWEVKSKNGAAFYYGGDPENGQVKEAVLTDYQGNVFKWALREVRDTNGNNMRYYYQTVTDWGVGNGESGPADAIGYELYLKTIFYTGHNGSDGLYKVEFIRDRELDEDRRIDLSISGRGGFKQVTADLLRRIEVTFNGGLVRSYELIYNRAELNPFNKTLLTGITQFGENGAKFYTHTFEYYDEARNGNGGYYGFSPMKPWNAGNDKIDDGIIGQGDSSAVSVTKTIEKGGSLSLSVGYGPASVGGSVSKSKSKSKGHLALVDINGDGLPDKVYKNNGGTIYYRPNVSGPHGEPQFGAPYAIASLPEISIEDSTTETKTISVGFGPAKASKMKQKTKTKQPVYFIDINGDGLVDLAYNGIVLFNCRNADGEVYFSPDSNNTPSPLRTGAAILDAVSEVNEQIRQEFLEDYPLLDVVRAWKASFDGEISITGTVALVEDNSPEAQTSQTADGVRVAIQLNNELQLWSDKIVDTADGPKVPVGVNSITVNKGDVVYFRVQSVEDGAYDKVQWNPVIQYLNIGTAPVLDANQSDVYRYEAAQDYTLAGSHRDTFVYVPATGKVRLVGTLKKYGVTTDDVELQILINDDSKPIYTQYLAWNEIGDIVLENEIEVAEQDRITVRVKIDSPIDMTKLGWLQDNQLAMYYVDSDNPRPSNLLCSYDMYPNSDLTAPLKAWIAPQTGIYAITPMVDVKNGESTPDSTIVATVKRPGELVGKHEIAVVNNVADNGSFTIEANQGDELYIEFSSLNHEFPNKLSQKAVEITGPDGSTISLSPAFYSAGEPQIIAQSYRGWTIFGYNGNLTDINEPMRITDADIRGDELIVVGNALQAASEDLQQATESEDKEALEALVEELIAKQEEALKNFPLNPFFPEPMTQRWRGTDEEASVFPDMMISSRNGLDSLDVPPALPQLLPSGAGSITKSSRCKGEGESLGLGPASGSKMESDCYGERDMIDVDGNRFPDIWSKSGITYTNLLGRFGDGGRFGEGGGDLRHTHAESESGGVGGGSGEIKIISNSKGRTDSNGFSSPAGNSYSASMHGSISLSMSEGDSDVKYDIMDINADGLPDKVNIERGLVALNIGYRFLTPEKWEISHINKGKNSGINVGAGIGGSGSIGNVGVGGGVGVSGGKSESESVKSLADINGDGAVDIIVSEGLVKLNRGGDFGPQISWPMNKGISVSKGISVGANASLNASIPVGGGGSVGIGGSASASETISHQEVQLVTDVNGDGYPDYAVSNDQSFVMVGLNQIGRTNLLKTVHRPLGATISLEYERNGNTYEQPQSHWDLSRVEVHDGHAGDGVDTLLTTYRYEDGFYNRQEREFYGYRTVVEEQRNSRDESLYRTVTRAFHNDSYYRKGLLESEVLADAQGNKYTETKNTYLLRNVDTGAVLAEENHLTATVFPGLLRTDTLFYEGGAMAQKSTYELYEYDELGNVIRFFDAGDSGSNDDVLAEIGYHSDVENYIVGKADSIVVRGLGRVMRQREANFETGTGNLLQVRQFLANGDAAVTDLEYDEYGNIKIVTGPANYKRERYALEYEYDPVVFTHNISVTDSFGYVSTADYNLKYGVASRTTDLNKNSIVYAFDNFGRVTQITGPYQLQSGDEYTIRFAYYHDAEVPWALTQHFDLYRDPADPIETALFVDGLTRVVQTKKDGTLHQGENGQPQDKMIVSGHTVFDFVGRAIEQYYPIAEPLGRQGVFNPQIDSIQPTVTTYDVMDRALSVTIPDNTSTTMMYGFGGDRSGRTQFWTKVTDANSLFKETFRDVRGLITSVKEYNEGEAIWTSYEYDPLKQIVTVIDDHSNVTKVQYDNLGRRTQIDSPDAGVTESVYDPASNVIRKITSNLRKQGLAIEYEYDYLRLEKIKYPLFPMNDVTYAYGEPGAGFNRANRIVTVSDESGMEKRFYGPQGEIIKTIKTLASDTQGNSANSWETYVTEYEFDTWNRLQNMTYPDGEVLTNLYDSGGLLRAASGEKDAYHYDYLNRLEYDKFSQRVFMEQGNGIRTRYSYNDENRRLVNLKAGRAAKSAEQHSRPLFQDLNYEYDNVGNIMGLQNLAAVTKANQMGGATQYAYQYDDLYRLTHAEGRYEFEPKKVRSFTLDMSYDSIHNILSKKQLDEITQPGEQAIEQRKTTYDWTYAYAGNQPHAPTHIGIRTLTDCANGTQNGPKCTIVWNEKDPVRIFTYDANGNQTGWEHTQNGTRRTIVWDEENRIQSIADNGHTMTYKYNDAGERVIKQGPQGETAYLNQFFSIRNREVGTKHIYAGTVRVVSKMMKQAKPGSNTTSPAHYPENEKDNSGQNAEKEKENQKEKNPPQGANKGQGKKTGILDNKGQNNENKGGGRANNPHKRPEEKDLYFYHPDHLGSSAYVTDADGEIYQHLEYFAFGETWVEESSNTQRTPYLYTAKELDEETQLSYFGARYYDPRTSVWQSPDPILEEYLSGKVNNGMYSSFNMGLYTYSYNNPIKYFDPDGRSPFSILAKQIAKVGFKKAAIHFAKKQILRRLGKYMTKKELSHFASDLVDIVGIMDSEWWEIGIELLPGVGDFYGAGRFAMKARKVYDKLQNLENKFVGKIARRLKGKERKRFLNNMRNNGVRDARKDTDVFNKVTGNNKTTKGLDGHHKNSVQVNPEGASDPRNIELLNRSEHLQKHNGNFRNPTTSDGNVYRN